MDARVCYKLSFDAFAQEQTDCCRFGNLRLYLPQMGSVCWGVRIFGVKHRSASLARATDDPVHKQRYQDLALELVLKTNNERGLDTTGPPRAADQPKSDGGNACPNK
jgi:hypothetical protein